MKELLARLFATPLSIMTTLEREAILQAIREHPEATALDRYCRGYAGAYSGIPRPGNESWFNFFHFMTMAEEYLKGTTP